MTGLLEALLSQQHPSGSISMSLSIIAIQADLEGFQSSCVQDMEYLGWRSVDGPPGQSSEDCDQPVHSQLSWPCCHLSSPPTLRLPGWPCEGMALAPDPSVKALCRSEYTPGAFILSVVLTEAVISTASPYILPTAGSVGPLVDVQLETWKPYAVIVNPSWRAATNGL